ncbi:Serine/threonine-protein kinase, active site [Sesbania bispinosa]|nr:Serine/threonine-protein kinase, active site [Sesbania bispinosa]
MPVNPWTLFFLCISLFLPYHSFIALAVNQQGEALLSWKRTLNGSVGVLSNWDPVDDTPCSWFGVSCNLKNEVVQLDLRYVDLLGGLPTNFTSLLSLNSLILTGTNLTGSIPKEIGNLGELSYLDLSDNALSGEIPSELCYLPKLQELHLNSNDLVGSIPVAIGNLTKLEKLTLYDNQLSGEIPSTIGNLGSLQVIRAGGNKNLEGPLPQEIGNCSNLVMLGLAETSISGFLPPTLGLLKKLETIAIYTSLLSGQIPLNLQIGEPYKPPKSSSVAEQLSWHIPPEIGNCYQLLVIDVSMNSITGSIPKSFGNLTSLQELQLSVNQISGEIPGELGNCQQLTHVELDNNQITGTIPSELGNLGNLTLLFLWHNKLQGNIPSSLSNCQTLEAIDLSQNQLTGPIPKGIFELKNLNKLLLLSNNLSGKIPSQIGNCSSLIRFRANDNNITGSIPSQIGNLKNLNFLDLGNNRISGIIPEEISGSRNLTFLDLHSNFIAGNLPESLSQLVSLQFLDVSDNMIEGTLSPTLGSLSALTKLVLRRIVSPGQFRVDSVLFQDAVAGPKQQQSDEARSLGHISQRSRRNLHYLADLQNLVVLNISYNKFSGRVPDTPFFAKLPLSVLTGNPSLCFSGNQCDGAEGAGKSSRRRREARVAMVVLLCVACVLLMAALYVVVSGKRRGDQENDADLDGKDSDVDMAPPWEVTLYQKLDLSISDVAKCLSAGNVIGHGRSGVVYRVNMPATGLTIAGCTGLMEWETRLKIALGVAEGLAYLHHDCVPAILHRDVKAQNILLGDTYEACLADFGFARFVEEDHASFSLNPQFAGSYGYIAPATLETEMEHLKSKKDPIEVLDSKLQGHPDTQIQEMLQALGISLLCTSNRAEDRPTMKDVAALLREIRHDTPAGAEPHKPKRTTEASSYSSSSVTPAQLLLLQSNSHSSSLAYSSSSLAPYHSPRNQS